MLENKALQYSSLDETKAWIRISASAMDRKDLILAMVRKVEESDLDNFCNELIKKEGRIKNDI